MTDLADIKARLEARKAHVAAAETWARDVHILLDALDERDKTITTLEQQLGEARTALEKEHKARQSEECSGWICSLAEHPGDPEYDDCEECEFRDDPACSEHIVRCPVCAALTKEAQS